MCLYYSDPNENKNRKERERYAQNRQEILKRQRQVHEQNKNIGSNIILDTPATGQSAVTQLQNKTSADVVAPNPVHSQRVILAEKGNMVDEDGSDWLPKNDEYQMERFTRRMTLTQHSGVEYPQLSAIATLRITDYPFENQG